MNRGKYSSRVALEARRRAHSKRKAAIISVALAGVLLTGGTVAYIMDKTTEVSNTFQSSHVSCEVQDNYAVKNTSDISAYIRVEVVVNWTDANGNIYHEPPVAYESSPSDYDYAVTLMNGWVEGADGYLYYSSPVSPNEALVPVEIEVSPASEEPGAEYQLKVQILAEAIQAAGEGSDGKAPVDSWDNDRVDVTRNASGTLTVEAN